MSIERALRNVQRDYMAFIMSAEDLRRAIELQASKVVRPHKPIPSDVSYIIEFVCNRYACPFAAIFTKRKHRYIADARQIAMALCRSITSFGIEDLGEFFCHDHTSICYAVKAIATRTEIDPVFKQQFSTLEAQVRSGIVRIAKAS